MKGAALVVAVMLSMPVVVALFIRTVAATTPATSLPGDELVDVEPGVPAYQQRSALTGTVVASGSSTVGTLLNRVAESFTERNPGFRLDMTLGVSSTGAAALLAGKTAIGAMSRDMTPQEMAAFKSKFGYEPLCIPVAVGATAIYVNADNPLPSITTEQLRRIFGQGSGPAESGPPLQRWGSLGLADEWKDLPITIYGLGAERSSSQALSEQLLRGGPVSAATQLQRTESSAVQAVAADRAGVGYAALLFRSRAVRVLPIAGDDGIVYECNARNCASSRYPLASRRYVYVNKPPGKQLDPAAAEFLRFVLSREGQQIMIRSGIYPVPRAEIEQARRLLD
ncbi:MAG TPA: PstS family phosphate ABC transporter substrate-binding protein [Tepidisphaeraceae bacterium]